MSCESNLILENVRSIRSSGEVKSINGSSRTMLKANKKPRPLVASCIPKGATFSFKAARAYFSVALRFMLPLPPSEQSLFMGLAYT